MKSLLWWWLLGLCFWALEHLSDEATRHAPALPRAALPPPPAVETSAMVNSAWAELERLRREDPARYRAVHGSLLGAPCYWRRA